MYGQENIDLRINTLNKRLIPKQNITKTPRAPRSFLWKKIFAEPQAHEQR